jgi:hypothetical protein
MATVTLPFQMGMSAHLVRPEKRQVGKTIGSVQAKIAVPLACH